MTENFVDIALYAGYILLLGSVLLGVLMPLINAVGNPKSLLKGFYGILFIVAVFGLAYIFSNPDQGALYTRFGYGPTESRLIGAGLISLYMLIIASILGMIGSEIFKIFK
ncbi:MAG TPA: hypothetical protein VI583_11275 [Cyclobacteriaceae bacterium]|nr:hypothetical protein [Cyclobacteriaceae bacterium]